MGARVWGQGVCAEGPLGRLGGPPLLELRGVRVELHLRALVVVSGTGLVDVVGLHLVSPVHLAQLLVLPVQPGGSGQGLNMCRGGSWASWGTGQGKSPPPNSRPTSSAQRRVLRPPRPRNQQLPLLPRMLV